MTKTQCQTNQTTAETKGKRCKTRKYTSIEYFFRNMKSKQILSTEYNNIYTISRLNDFQYLAIDQEKQTKQLLSAVE